MHIPRNSTRTSLSSHPTDQYFCLPRIFLLGFPKCGTTLLYQYIESHPLFAKPRFKESQFWREIVRTDETEYKELEVLLYLFHFFDASKKIKINTKMFSIDASASTVFASSQPYVNIENDVCVVPLLLSKLLPESKLLMIVRNPIDRLWSDFWYFCFRSRWGASGVKVPESILLQGSELFHNYTLFAIGEFLNCINIGHSLFHCTTLEGSVAGEDAACSKVRLSLSMYFVHFVRWLSVFPRSQMLVMRIEDLTSNSLIAMKRVWSFLGVFNHNKVINYKVNSNSVNINSKYADHFKMWPETRDILRDFFYPYNFMLAKLLDDQQYLWKE